MLDINVVRRVHAYKRDLSAELVHAQYFHTFYICLWRPDLLVTTAMQTFPGVQIFNSQFQKLHSPLPSSFVFVFF